MVGLSLLVHGAALQMIVTESAPPLLDHLIAHADRHLTLKQADAGNLIIGGGWTAGFDAAGFPQPLRPSIEGNLWVAERVVPALAGLHVIRSWAGMNLNLDGAPLLGEAPGLPGFFNVVTANGYTLAPLVAQITAELIRTGTTRRDIDFFTLARFPAFAAS
jgi:D-hydroxyproline dehydrogenase subunit alpha